jgi:hypothetical protein
MISTWGKSHRQLVREIRRREAAGAVGGLIGWLLVIAWRFLPGDHPDGVARTNATWTTRATESYTSTGRASAWASLARAERMVIWSGSLLIVGLARAAYAVNPGVTTLILRVGALAFAIIFTVYGISRLRRRRAPGSWVFHAGQRLLALLDIKIMSCICRRLWQTATFTGTAHEAPTG